jgi:hypothetical protein
VSSATTTNVSAAFDILLEAMEEELGLLARSISSSAAELDFKQVSSLSERAKRLTEIREKASDLRDEWSKPFTLAVPTKRADKPSKPARRRQPLRLDKGARTANDAYVLPILETLGEMGGSGRPAEVLDHVGKSMQHQLKDADFEPVGSNPNRPRWKATAYWARYQMVRDGLLKDDSHPGMWDISDKGREFLKNARKS